LSLALIRNCTFPYGSYTSSHASIWYTNTTIPIAYF